jgi:hypothetical protein
MTRDDIIRMAREAGAVIVYDAEVGLFGDAKVEAFANLVAAAEREACIRDCDSVDLVGADDCIAAIRARGQE